MAGVRPLGALVDVGADQSVTTPAGGARAGVAAFRVCALAALGGAIVRACHTLVNVPAEKAIALVPDARTRALVRAIRVGADGARVARVERRIVALVDLLTGGAIAVHVSVASRAHAGERAQRVGAAGGIVAVVGACSAFVDFDASIRSRRVSTSTLATTAARQVRKARRADSAVLRTRVGALGASAVASLADICGRGEEPRRASGTTLAVVFDRQDRRARDAVAGGAAVAGEAVR
eukprot:scaffold25307_cov109-Isochrysis_galbana.AAC.1